MTGLKLTLISKVGNWLLHLGWVSGYKTDSWDFWNLNVAATTGSLDIDLCEWK